jgi:ectoine hydroxylase-related dioxygenase (phytanoyl-CoA dioxygenase family)
MPKLLDQAAIDRYHAEGIYFPIRIFTEEQCAEFVQKFEETQARDRLHIKRKDNQMHNSHMLVPWISDLIHNPKLLDAVEDVLGPNILCWNTQFFAKKAHDPRFVSWHQDSTYYGLSSNEVVTAWVALTPSRRENGCMRVVPGSHKAQVPHNDTFDENNFLTRGQEIAVEVNEADIVNVELEPGQMSLHNVRTFHGSEANTADYPRIGFAIRYIPTHVYQTTGLRDSATLVRGVDSYGHFNLEPRPESEFHADAIARHTAAVEMQLQILYAGAAQVGKRAADETAK